MSEPKPTKPAAVPEFVISRVFDAPREAVFQAWTEKERLASWWGPKGFTMKVSSLDLRAGGMFLYCMRAPDGRDMWGKFEYREIVVPERISFINAFSNEQGHSLRNPFAPVWPLEVLNTLTFEDQAGKTKFTMAGAPLNATDAECKAFDDHRESMRGGFKGTLDQLAEYLAKA